MTTMTLLLDYTFRTILNAFPVLHNSHRLQRAGERANDVNEMSISLCIIIAAAGVVRYWHPWHFLIMLHQVQTGM